jgi:hypothetical protein
MIGNNLRFSLFHPFLRISRVFVCVKAIFSHIILLFLLSTSVGLAQKQRFQSASMGFADSVRIALENTRNLDAQVVGSGFSVAWNNILLDQQNRIQQQFRAMKRRGFKLRPHMVQYFGAIVSAVNVEGIDVRQFNNYLNVADKVIENYKPDRAINFFKTSRAFFLHHALYFDNTHRIYAKEGDYSFEFIEYLPPPEDSVASIVETQYSDDTWQDNWEESVVDTLTPRPPLWMTPPPQPEASGAVIRFSKTNLTFVTKYDSATLRNTKGVFSLTDYIFIGENGVFDWTGAGLSADSVYCNFSVYNFNVKKPELKADLVQLNYTGKTPGLVYGKFEFRSQPRKSIELAAYPRFTSYESNLDIKGLGKPNMSYRGGFSLQGQKVLSTSVFRDYATIEVMGETDKKFKARSKEFIFKDSTILSNQTVITLFQQSDSITHRSVQFKYDFAKEQLLLQSEKGGMRNTPYSSSFFNIDFAANIIRWDLQSDSLNILTQGGRSTVPMIIESVDYYDREDFILLSGTGFKFHPLAVVANYCIQNATREFYSSELARYFDFNFQEVQKAMEFLAMKGLVEYWPRRDYVVVKEKAVTQFLAFKGQMDYDNMKIHSVIGSHPNATVNFARRDMVVRGVEEFNISDSLNVIIKPDSSVITILQNRDMRFDGKITAGNFEITGKDFTLKYDSFLITLNKIDSINFFTMERNARGQMVRKKINNALVSADSTAAEAGGLGDVSSTSGTLFINRPGNKSGKIKIPNYPRLDASAGGVIYFDKPEILNGVYDRSVFFAVPPFKLDSLNDADPTSLNFDGTFVSSGMFPSFKEKLHTMADKSLGFEHILPPGGYNLYNSEAKLYGVVTLNNRGLRAPGKIEYLSTTVQSNEFIFYPDSVGGRGTRAKISPTQFGAVVFPQASLPNYQMKWLPKQDQMRFRNTNVPFNFYDSTAQLTGTITVSKNGVSGIGKLETRGSELRSREMSFSANEFGARHSRFKAKSDDPNKPLIEGIDVRVKFNLAQNYADVSPEIAGEAAINFPFAQFKTSIPNARWDLTTQKITMSKRPDQPIEDSYFYTTRKDLDSLSFYAEHAEYDLKTQELKVSGIPYIVVADAKITPENNEVLILENARIGTLKNTTIVLDTLNGYHHLTDGVITIVSRKEFSGHATYQYVNLLNDTFAIKMTDFHLEPVVETQTTKKTSRRKSVASMQTVGVGTVTEKDNIVLGAGMFYKGDLTMYATKPALQLTGYVKLDIKRIKNYNTWIRHTQTGDETDILIDFDNALNEDGKRVDAGLHYSAADNNLYFSFMNDKQDDDEDFFIPSGKLFYDNAAKEYKIEDPEKAAGTKLSGKVFSYNDETAQVRFEGPISLMRGVKDFSITATAIGQGSMENNEVTMNTMVIVSTTAAPLAFEAMARNLQAVIQNEGAEEGLGDRTDLLYKVADIVGERAAKDYENRSQQGYVSLGTLSETAKPLNFANVTLKWSGKQKAFYSEGLLGVSNSNRNDINGAFEGFMEVKKNEDGGPVFNVFFKASPEAWYYFGYEDNRLLMYSSNNEFNTAVAKKANSGKAKVGEMVYLPGSEDEALAFINRFRRDYYGIEVPYRLSADTGGRRKEEKKKADDDGF